MERAASATRGTYCAWKSTTTGLGLFTTRSWKSLPSCTLKVFLRPAEVLKALPWDTRDPRAGRESNRQSASLWAICGESGWWGGGVHPMARPTAAASCSESPRQDSPQAKGCPGVKFIGYDMGMLPSPVPRLCPALRLQPHSHRAPSWTPPPPRLQETAPGSGSSFPSALQSRAVLTARSSTPTGQTQAARFPQLRYRGASSADVPIAGTGPPAPNPVGENSPRRRRSAAPRARRQEGHSREGPAPPAGPAPVRTFTGAEVTRTQRTSARRPARLR